ncbi:MAG: thiol:disulfide interchange protein DsbA/DsbL [Candidatus Competibacteraceae bacterium]
MLNVIRRLLFVLLTGILSLALTYAADDTAAPPFQEGKDYARLSTPVPTSAPGKIEVVEMFSYSCPHCNHLEPTVQEWLKRKPDNVVFVRIPVVFAPNWEAVARAYYVAETLGVLEKVHQPLLNAIHVEKRKLNTEDELAGFFAEHGVDADAFHKAYKSFQVETQLRRGNQLAQRYGVQGVPAVIVNGKYDVRSARMFDVVDFLIAKEAASQG